MPRARTQQLQLPGMPPEYHKNQDQEEIDEEISYLLAQLKQLVKERQWFFKRAIWAASRYGQYDKSVEAYLDLWEVCGDKVREVKKLLDELGYDERRLKSTDAMHFPVGQLDFGSVQAEIPQLLGVLLEPRQ